MRRIFAILLCVVATVVFVGCEDIRIEVITSDAYVKTEEVKGDSKNCAVVLRAQQGTSYTIAIESEGAWATFSGGKTCIDDTMTSSDKVVYIYFNKNSSGVSRTANINVSFSDGSLFELSFTQHSYDSSIAFSREWAELPVCKEVDFSSCGAWA